MLFDGSAATWLFDEQYVAFLRSAIAEARTRVLVQQFVVDIRPDEDTHREVRYVLHALAEATHRGLDVRVLMPSLVVEQPPGFNMNETAFRFLSRRKVPTRILAGSLGQTHAKAVALDDELLIAGSHNWTPTAFRINSETSIAIRSEESVRQFAECYNVLWQQGSESPC